MVALLSSNISLPPPYRFKDLIQAILEPSEQYSTMPVSSDLQEQDIERICP